MKKASTLATAASGTKIRKAARSIELLEPRAYLSGAVFGNQQNLSASSAGIAPVYVIVDDITGDGKPDLISSNQGNTVTISNGDGTGKFSTSPTTVSVGAITPLTLADAKLITGNNNLDIVVGSTSNNQVGVILQPTSGTFSESSPAATGLSNTRSLALGDFAGNGRTDIAVASYDGGTTNNVAIFMNNGSGTFTLSQVLSVPHTHLTSLTTFNTNNGVALAVSAQDSNTVTTILNNGSGTFAVGQDYGVGTAPVTIKSGKFNLNNDNNDDLVTANSGSGNVSVLLGNGLGGFGTAVNTAVSGVPGGGGPLKVRVANLTNSGKPDLLSLLPPGSSGDAETLLGNGDGTFHVGNIISTGGNTRASIAAGDLNSDGLTDLVLADPTQVSSLINITASDTTAPTAAVDVTQPATAAGAATIQFTVTYTDAQQVDAGSLGNGNVTVTDPNGVSHPATLVSTGLANNASVTATYSIPTQSGSAGTADDGTYTVVATSSSASAVKNANGVAVAGGTIGTFVENIPVIVNGPNLVAGAVVSKQPASVVAGSRSTNGASITVVNSGNQPAVGTIRIDLYASPDQTIRGGAPILASIAKKIKLKVGARQTFTFPKFIWPASLSGTYFLVANVNSTDSIAETNFSDNVGISGNSVIVAAPFVDIQNLWSGRLPVLKAGKKVTVPVLIQNNGNSTARGTATVTVLASPDGAVGDATTLATVPVGVNVGPGKKQTLNVKFTDPTIASGTYNMIVVVTFPTSTNAADTTVVSPGTFTV